MSDVAINPAAPSGDSAFKLVTVIVLVAIGLIGFVAIALTSTYMPNGQTGGSGGGHALSNAATGFSGIVRLERAMGADVSVIRDDNDLGKPGLMVLTPLTADTPMTDPLARRRGAPTLVVLPKWNTVRDRAHPGWVGATGLLPPQEPYGVLAPGNKLAIARANDDKGGRALVAAGFLTSDIRFAAPKSLQTMSGDKLKPLIVDGSGKIVLGQIGDEPFYVLADPDLLANMGLSDAANAQSAVALLDQLKESGDPLSFDVTLDGLGRPPSPLRLALDPPFLAMTLTLFVAMLLAGWQAFARFGPAARRDRAIAFGKTALVDNSAALISKARRQVRLGGRYVEVIRDRAITAFGVPSRLKGDAIDSYLDKLNGQRRFTELAQAVEDAHDKTSLVAAAQALHDWQKERDT
ncbi:MAG: DUF4350 domain-containing protein [Pseudomonadota bacterium]